MGLNIKHTDNFSMGEIDPRVFARVNFDGYYKGAQRLRNVMVLPQGGATRRFGTKYIDDLATAASSDEARIQILSFNDKTHYLLLFEDLTLKIYRDGSLLTSLASPYAGSEISEMKSQVYDNTLITVHHDYAPYQLIYDSGAGTWSYAAVTFKNIPTYDFNKDYDAANFTPSAVTGSITLTAAAGTPFTADHVGGLYFGNEGTMRITGFSSTTVVTGYTISDFKNTNAIQGRDSILTEPAWSATLGYPKIVTVYQDRLVLGNSPDLPQGIWLSATNEIFNFDDSKVFDDSAITIFANIGKSNVVEGLLGAKSLWVFTPDGVLSTPYLQLSPLTPTNAAISQQSANGINEDVDPIYFDNKVIYVDKGGKIIWSLIYEVQRQSMVPFDVSILSQHLVRTPVDVGSLKHPTQDLGNYLLYINLDGTMAIYQSLQSQNVSAWSLADTDGYFRQVTADENDVYFLVEREINGVTKLYIEQVDFDLKTDCTYTNSYVSPVTVINNLNFLEGETVKVIGDGYVLADQVVTGGSITIERAVSEIEVGLPVIPLVSPMPPHTPNDFYNSKRIQSVYVTYYESLGIYVNGQVIPDLYDGIPMDQIPVPQNGTYRVNTLQNFEQGLSFDADNLINITQLDPLPFTILAIGLMIQVQPLE